MTNEEVVLRGAAHRLAMLGYESSRYVTDRDFNEAVQRVLEITLPKFKTEPLANSIDREFCGCTICSERRLLGENR